MAFSFLFRLLARTFYHSELMAAQPALKISYDQPSHSVVRHRTKGYRGGIELWQASNFTGEREEAVILGAEIPASMYILVT